MLKMVCTERKFILTIIMTLALLIALLGIGGSSYAKTSNNKFNSHTVIETQIIEVEGSVSEIGQWVAESYPPFFTFAPTAFYVVSFRYEVRNVPYSLTTLIPARAPPSIN
jgi:hypothetical protein